MWLRRGREGVRGEGERKGEKRAQQEKKNRHRRAPCLLLGRCSSQPAARHRVCQTVRIHLYRYISNTLLFRSDFALSLFASARGGRTGRGAARRTTEQRTATTTEERTRARQKGCQGTNTMGPHANRAPLVRAGDSSDHCNKVLHQPASWVAVAFSRLLSLRNSSKRRRPNNSSRKDDQKEGHQAAPPSLTLSACPPSRE